MNLKILFFYLFFLKKKNQFLMKIFLLLVYYISISSNSFILIKNVLCSLKSNKGVLYFLDILFSCEFLKFDFINT